MTERERLIELLKADNCPSPMLCDSKCKYAELQRCYEYRIADYLLENGVIVPPVKIGEELWIVFTPKYPANPNDKGKRFVTQEGVQRIICGAKGLSIETWNMGTISAKEFGKTIFLTEEEAEKALNTFQNGKG